MKTIKELEAEYHKWEENPHKYSIDWTGQIIEAKADTLKDIIKLIKPMKLFNAKGELVTKIIVARIEG